MVTYRILEFYFPHAFTIVFVKLPCKNPPTHDSSSQTQTPLLHHSQHSRITHNRITTDPTHSTPSLALCVGLQKNAIILFVNLRGREYENLFYTNDTATSAVSLDWYASSKAKPDSRAIQRLSTATEEREDFGVFLFLRFEGEPYLCCGPCLVEEKDLDPRPMRFRLKILNTAAIMTRAWKLFDQLLKGQREEEES